MTAKSDEWSSPETATRVLMHLVEHVIDDSGLARTSLRDIGDALGIRFTTAQRAMNRLVAAGQVSVVRRGTGRSYPTTYRVDIQ